MHRRRLLRRAGAVGAAAIAAVGVAVITLPRSSGDGDRGFARNVVVVVGDGMGAGQRRLARLVSIGPGGALHMDRLRYTGRVRPRSADPSGPVVDSAAAATGFATGVATVNGAVGVDPGGRPLTSVLDLARRAGKSTGIVTTSQVTDATPAAFGASARSRDDHREIARQYVESSRPEVILGGGARWWSGDLLSRARRLGYEYVTDGRRLRAARGPRILGLFAGEEMFAASGGSGAVYAPAVSLAEMTRTALRVLSRTQRGFFLLVEEEAIDGMSHANNAAAMVEAVQELDRAVAAVRAFARRNAETLTIVFGDHETGGLRIEPAARRERNDDGPFPVPGSSPDVQAQWSTTGHTRASTPITAAGPGARLFEGALDNTDVFARIVRAAQLRPQG
jgi:alkaline phosphatase